MEKKQDENYKRILEATSHKNSSTYLQSQKLSKYDEQDIRDSAGMLYN